MTVRQHLRARAGHFTGGALLLVLTNLCANAVPWVMKRVVEAMEAGTLDAVRVGCLTLAGLALLSALFRVLSRIGIFNGARLVEYDVRNRLFAHLTTMPPSWFQRWPTGDLMSRVTNDVSYVRLMFGPGILNLVNTACAYAMALPLLLVLDAPLAIYTVLPIPLMLALSRNIARAIQRRQRVVQDQLAAMSARLHETLSGVGVVKALAMEPREAAAFDDHNAAFLERSLRLASARSLFMPLVGSVAGVSTLIVLFAGGGAVATGRMSLGDLVAFMGYLGLLTWPTLALGWVISSWQRGRAALDRIREVLDEAPSIADAADAQPLPAPRGALSVRGLTFSYPAATAPAVRDVSVDVAAGGSLGVVGPTASGKSTLVKCLPRLLEVPEGSVLLDGHDVTTLRLRDLRGAIALVPQESFLFSTTLLRNIAFGGPPFDDDAAEADAVTAASRLAALHRDVDTFPDGYATVVGERGITLSGGQKQRASIARALMADRPVLVLDDALSSVDAATEQAILDALRGVAAGRTTVVVSHRMSAVAWCDEILVLTDGRVVERGTHDQLVASDGWYADMWDLQQAEQAPMEASA